jgi:hypothetical protein
MRRRPSLRPRAGPGVPVAEPGLNRRAQSGSPSGLFRPFEALSRRLPGAMSRAGVSLALPWRACPGSCRAPALRPIPGWLAGKWDIAGNHAPGRRAEHGPRGRRRRFRGGLAACPVFLRLFQRPRRSGRPMPAALFIVPWVCRSSQGTSGWPRIRQDAASMPDRMERFLAAGQPGQALRLQAGGGGRPRQGAGGKPEAGTRPSAAAAGGAPGDSGRQGLEGRGKGRVRGPSGRAPQGSCRRLRVRRHPGGKFRGTAGRQPTTGRGSGPDGRAERKKACGKGSESFGEVVDPRAVGDGRAGPVCYSQIRV